MKVAFVANSHGNLDLLERFLVMLIETEGVETLVAVGNAAHDVDAALRARQARFPVAVQWAEPEFPDFVLASVLGGVTDAPDSEMQRSAAISAALCTDPGVEVGGVRISIERANTQPDEGAHVVVISRPETAKVRRGEVIRICPGHVRAHEYERAPASCVLIETVENGVQARFLGVDGDSIGKVEALSAS